MNCTRNNFYSPRWKIILCFLLISLIGNNNRIKAEDLNQKFATLSEREIHMVKTVDVLIIGITVPAFAADENGASVFLLSPHLYFGEDLFATLCLEIDNMRGLFSRHANQILKTR